MLRTPPWMWLEPGSCDCLSLGAIRADDIRTLCMSIDTAETSSNSLQRTPLHDLHLTLRARMVAFAGYEMPLHYAAGVLKEHLATRVLAGLFDVSHMGQIAIRAKWCSRRSYDCAAIGPIPDCLQRGVQGGGRGVSARAPFRLLRHRASQLRTDRAARAGSVCFVRLGVKFAQATLRSQGVNFIGLLHRVCWFSHFLRKVF